MGRPRGVEAIAESFVRTSQEATTRNHPGEHDSPEDRISKDVPGCPQMDQEARPEIVVLPMKSLSG